MVFVRVFLVVVVFVCCFLSFSWFLLGFPSVQRYSKPMIFGRHVPLGCPDLLTGHWKATGQKNHRGVHDRQIFLTDVTHMCFQNR